MVSAQAAVGPGSSALPNVARRTAVSAVWAVLAFGASRVLSYGTNVVLARLLAPADFGLVSFALIFINAGTLLQDLGVSAALVFGGRDARTVAGTALTINVVAASALCLVAIAASPFVAMLQADHNTPVVLIALSFGLVVTSLGSVQSAVLMKELDYRRKFIPDALPFATGGLVSVVMALTGFGVWSLVVGNLVRAATSSGLLWMMSSLRPRPAFHWPVAVDLLRYGRHVALSSILGFVSNNVDYFVIGYALGATPLGIYTMAYVIATLVPSVSGVAVSVMFPALSRVRDDQDALDAIFTDANRILWALSTPLAILIFIGAPAFVHTMLGDRWTAAILPLRILAASAWLQSVTQIFSPASKAVGRPDLLWKFILVRTLTSVPLLLLSVRFGIAGVASCVVLLLLVFVPASAIILSRAIRYSPWRLLKVVAPSMAAAAAMCAVVAVVYAVPDVRAMAESLAGSIALATVLILVYVTVLFRLDPYLPGLVRARLRQRQATSAQASLGGAAR